MILAVFEVLSDLLNSLYCSPDFCFQLGYRMWNTCNSMVITRKPGETQKQYFAMSIAKKRMRRILAKLNCRQKRALHCEERASAPSKTESSQVWEHMGGCGLNLHKQTLWEQGLVGFGGIWKSGKCTNCVAQRVPCPKQGLNLPGKEQWTAGVEAEGKSSSPTSAQFLGCEELNPEMSKRKCCFSALTCRKRGHSGVGAQPGQSLRSAQAKLRPGPRDACSPRPLPNPRLRKRLASFYEISRTKLYVNIH